MMDLIDRLIDFRERNVEPVVNAPFFAELLSGEPTTTAWRLAASDDGKVFSGFWSATPGKWRMDYAVWEFCHILEGACVLVPDGEAPRQYGPGDTFVCQPGLRGTWEVIAPVKKVFVVRKA